MRYINPMAKAWSNAAKSQRRSELAAAYRRRFEREAEEFHASKHLYERTFSDQPVGEQRTMSGQEAKELNDKLFNDFLAAVTRNVEGRSLERWEVITKFVDREKK